MTKKRKYSYYYDSEPKKFTAICPRCHREHIVKGIQYIGKGTPRFNCPACKAALNDYDSSMVLPHRCVA